MNQAGRAIIGAFCISLSGISWGNPVVLDVAALASGCDAVFSATQLGRHDSSEELGSGQAFPSDELIRASVADGGSLRACSARTSSNSVLVSITNLTGAAWNNLFYVAESETTMANPDLLINGLQAFRIDNIGNNVTLRTESQAQDGVFAVDETWTFLIDGYSNSQGLDADALGVLGLPSPLAGPFNPSSGNVVSMNCIPDDCCDVNADRCFVPEPGSASLVVMALMSLAWLRRAGAGVRGRGLIRSNAVAASC